MTVYLITDTDENRYVANATGVIDFARNNYDIKVEDIDEIETAINELDDHEVDVMELDFDEEPIIPV